MIDRLDFGHLSRRGVAMSIRTRGFFACLILAAAPAIPLGCGGGLAIGGPDADASEAAALHALYDRGPALEDATAPDTGAHQPEAAVPEAALEVGIPDANNSEALVMAPPRFTLTSLGSKLPPLPSGVGITWDGQELWLLSGGAQGLELARFDRVTLAVDRTVTLPTLFTTLATSASGIAWDGTSIWVLVGGDTNALFAVDPISGAVTKTLGSPSQSRPCDLDFDGANLWLTNSYSSAFSINLATSDIQSFPVATWRSYGIAFHAGQLFISDLFGYMQVYDATTGAALGSAVHPDGTTFGQTEVGPMVFAGDELVVLSGQGIASYTVTSR
jgi:hypothetical protein